MEIMKIWRQTMEKGSPKNDIEKANKVKMSLSEMLISNKMLKEYFDIDDIDPNEKKRLCVKHVINHLHIKINFLDKHN